MSNQEASSVRVVCRFRPQNSKEIAAGGTDIISVDPSGTAVTVKGAESTYNFNFDKIFPPGTSQKDVYVYAAKPVVDDILKGYNGTIFVYGQTSSGKTHTMQGPDINDIENRGVIPRMNSHIFEAIASSDPNIEFLVKASYIEIYMEKIRDLLDTSKDNLKVREEKSKGIWVDGATEIYVSNEQEVLDVITTGTANRAIAETNMNNESSRSHSIFILTVQQKNLNDLSNKQGKLYLVDLAGSEKVEKTGATGTTLDEAKMINKSLSTLGNVINALTDGKSTHVPYRDSKLTRVLQESIGGNSRTTLCINCSPSNFNEAETVSTLRFGQRAKAIKNKAKINQERSVGELKLLLGKAEKEIDRLQATISTLESDLVAYRGGGPPPNRPSGTAESVDGQVAIGSHPKLQEKLVEMENAVRKLEEEKAAIQEMHDNFLDEMKEKEQELEMLDQLKDEVNILRSNEATMSKENELLIVKLADMTISNEKMQFDNNELMISVENLRAQNAAYTEELNQMKRKMEEREHEKPKPIAKTWSEEGKELHSSEEPVKSAPKDYDQIASLRMEIESQKTQIELLKREKELQDLNMQKLRTEYEQQILNDGGIPVTPSPNANSPDYQARLEKEIQMMKDHTNQKLQEFDALKNALLQDLESRCQKVIELEMLLDEAREQYQALLVQVKNSNTKALQQKCVFLQRNLEQMTAVQQQVINENNRLKLENQVCMKQLAIRNERISGLEMLLNDAQDKLLKHAASDDVQIHGKSGSFKVNPNARKPGMQPALNTSGGRIAKPIRGGGGGGPKIGENSSLTNTGSTNSYGSGSGSQGAITPQTDRKSSSIWDIFRTKKTDAKDGSDQNQEQK